MADGLAITQFNDFVKSTGPVYLTSPDQILNEVQRNGYLLKKMLKGRTPAEVLQSGSEIRDTLYLVEQSTYARYKPGADFQWSNPQVLDEFKANWRFSVDHMAWNEEELLLNVPDGVSKAGLKVIYKKLKKAKEMRMWTSMTHGMEDDIGGNPHASGAHNAMEISTGDTVYPIFTFANENTNGLPNGWTNIQNLAPATYAGWRPQQVQYDATDPSDSDDDRDGLLNAFDDMWLNVQFEPPGTKDEYFEDVKMGRQTIAASQLGINQYKDLLRESNDSLSGAGSASDPAYNSPLYSGIPLYYWPKLDTVSFYTSDGGTTFDKTEAQSGVTNSGARYYWWNFDYIKPVWHTQRYMHKHEPRVHPNQPFTWVCPVNTYWNLVCSSIRRQGVVYPGA